MANTIRILRSASTNTPASLLQGELANSELGSPNSINELFVGTAGPTVFKLISNVGGNPATPNATITTGTGIDGADAGSMTDLTLSLALDELPVSTMTGADWIAFDNAGVSNKALISTIPLSLFNDDLGHVENVSTTLSEGTRTATTYGITSDGSANDIILPVFNSTQAGLSPSSGGGTTNYLRADGTWAAPPGASASNSFATHTITDTDSGYTWAETGSAVAVLPADTLTWVSGTDIDIDVDATSQAIKVAFTNASGFTTNVGDVTSVSAGTLIDVTGTTAVPIVNVDLSEAAEAAYAPATDYLLFLDGGATGSAGKESGADFAAALAGTGLDSSGGVMQLDLAELGVTTMAASDWIAFDDAGVSSKALISSINLSLFNNNSNWETNDPNTVLSTDTSVSGWSFVLDEDAMGSNSATKVPTQQSVKAYVDNAVTGGLTYKGAYNASTNTPALDTGSPTLVTGDMYTVTAAGNFFTVPVEIGDVLIAEVDSVDTAAVTDWTIVQANIGGATETAAGYIELATQAEMNTATDDVRAVTPLKYANSTIDGGTF